VPASSARLREFLPTARELAGLFAARGLACVVAWHAGFRALSDDDYARIVIAQRFAHAPAFDPSGTSWLPVPFWAYGAAFRVFGTGLDVARATAIGLGLASTLAVYVAARLLGASNLGALLSAAASSLLVPYSTLLGLAAVPELPCAALLLFSAATLARAEPALRAWGGVALLFASWSRYEAWPIALVFALFCAWDALRQRRLGHVVGGVLALAGPLGWLALGHAEHGDALFFVARVTAYRRALGGLPESLWQRVREYPFALFANAPVLCGAGPVLAWFARRRGISGLRSGRCLLSMLALLAFLVLGSTRDGVPTHHAARVLLPLWLLGSVFIGHSLAELSPTRTRAALTLGLLALAALPSLRPFSASCAERSAELTAGRAARQFTSAGLAIDTADYGYFAVQAAFGSPRGTSVLDDHDPRHASKNPFGSTAALDGVLQKQALHFALVTTEHAALLPARCSARWASPRYALFECPD